MGRDEFTQATRRILAERAGQRCCNPTCFRATSGPADSKPGVATVLGKAAHITAAAVGGPRFDPSLSTAERRSAENGIWLCSVCADRVDKIENVDAFPVEILRFWKTRSEALTGTDQASAEERRRYPIFKLRIVDFAGVRGAIEVQLGRLTLFRSTSHLMSYSISEILGVFAKREVFERRRQPKDGIKFPFDHKVPLLEDLGITVNAQYDKPRRFADQAKVYLVMSDGTEYIWRVTSESGELFCNGAKVNPYTAVLNIVEVIPDRRIEGSTPIETIAGYFETTPEELLECLQGSPADDSIFGLHYRIEDSRCLFRTNLEMPFVSYEGLSSGEQERIVLDLAVRIACAQARVKPVVLLLDQRFFGVVDSTGVRRLLEWIDTHKPPFQTIIDLIRDPSCDLKNALCYRASGGDMNVTAIELTPWIRFKNQEDSSKESAPK